MDAERISPQFRFNSLADNDLVDWVVFVEKIYVDTFKNSRSIFERRAQLLTIGLSFLILFQRRRFVSEPKTTEGFPSWMVSATDALPVMNSKNGFQSVKFILRINSSPTHLA